MEWKMNHAIVYPTVDCAIFSDHTLGKILLARKKGQTLYRFVGGFVDPSDFAYEIAALREANEETRLKCHDVAYVTSQKVNDPRYAEKEDKIITTLFAMVSAQPLEDAVASDDIEEVKVFNFAEIGEDMLVSEHRPLFAALRIWRWNYLKANGEGEAK